MLDGFTVEGASDPCFLVGVWTNPGYSGTHGGHQILNNIIQNNIAGIELDSDGTYPALVRFNLIQNNNNPSAKEISPPRGPSGWRGNEQVQRNWSVSQRDYLAVNRAP